MSIIAAVRPDSWNFPLLIHIVGAVTLVGGILTCATFLGFARGDSRLLRLGYWSLLAVALPGWIIMRIGAEWIYSKEGWDDIPESVSEPDWLGIGWIAADLGGLILLVSLILGGIGVRRLGEGKGAGLLKTVLVLSIVLLAIYVTAAWAMAGKPRLDRHHPGYGSIRPSGLVPVVAVVDDLAVAVEAQHRRARERDRLAFLDPARPPFHGRPVAGDDRLAEAARDVGLLREHPPEIARGRVRLTEGEGAIRGVVRV